MFDDGLGGREPLSQQGLAANRCSEEVSYLNGVVLAGGRYAVENYYIHICILSEDIIPLLKHFSRCRIPGSHSSMQNHIQRQSLKTPDT
jgi:hypothetical protein